MLGQPVLLDAARVGSAAHRLRNYWTNLAAQARIQHTLDQVQDGPAVALEALLAPGWKLAPVQRADPAPYFFCNMPGKPRAAWPTFVSYIQYRAFRPGCPGAIHTVDQLGAVHQWAEPPAACREAAMGMESGASAVPGFTEDDRLDLLGRVIDPLALQAVMSVAHAWWHRLQPL